jgi:hypothetical protein
VAKPLLSDELRAVISPLLPSLGCAVIYWRLLPGERWTVGFDESSVLSRSHPSRVTKIRPAADAAASQSGPPVFFRSYTPCAWVVSALQQR